MRNILENIFQNERGQGLILFAFAVVAMTGFTAMTVDVGLAYREKGNAQGAADSAALAAAGILYAGGGNDAAAAEAVEIAAANGYVDGVDGITVDVNIPPASGHYAGQSSYTEVLINSSSSAQFATIFGINAFDINARAVGGGINSSGDYGIVALNETQCKAFSLDGTIDIYIRAAGIFVNSDCPTDAFWANGNVTVDTEINSVVGGWTGVGTISINPPPSSAAPITDPLAGLPVPVPPTNVQPCPEPWSGTITLQPGRYDCTLDPSGNDGIIFAPGNYYITGGVVANGGGNITFNAGEYTLGGVGIKVTGAGRITANQALIYVEAGEVDLTGNGVTRLIAPTSGPYAGISIFQNRTLDSQVNINGTALTAGSGAVYAKAAKVSIVGTSDSNNMQFVSDTFQMSGSASLVLDAENNIDVRHSYLKLVE